MPSSRKSMLTLTTLGYGRNYSFCGWFVVFITPKMIIKHSFYRIWLDHIQCPVLRSNEQEITLYGETDDNDASSTVLLWRILMSPGTKTVIEWMRFRKKESNHSQSHNKYDKEVETKSTKIRALGIYFFFSLHFHTWNSEYVHNLTH